ncbi:MAG: hypothetical protein JRE28_13600 [Deltaproteobacteria bacterium]|nr:hypothetical protein [Deltaproteobacteria bacterium]
MNSDPEQKKDHSESRPQPENKLESIRDISRAIKEGEDEYAERLSVLVDLLSDVNASLEKIIGIGTLLENHLGEIKAGITAIVARANIPDGENELRKEIDRILFNRPPEWSANLMAWLREYHGP